MPDVKRAMIIGLDCAEPSLVLGRFRDQLPTLSALADAGAYGRLESVVPPITVPAWSCMMSSRTPGDLGIYGFRNRADHSYDGLFIANGAAVKEPRLWDIVGRRGLRSIVLGVPGTFPVRPLNGVMVSCFLTPSTQSQYTFPPALRNEVEDVVGEYLFDCTEFRTEDKDDLLRQIYEMTDKRFKLADHFLSTKPWELFAMVEMGTDRIHHGFWKDMDPAHRKHVPGGAYEKAILDYHVHVDGLRGESAAPRRRRDRRAGRLRPRRQAHGRRHPHQRVAAPGGPAGAPARARGPLQHARLRHRLVAHEGLGRGRLLLARLPQRGGARARGDDPGGRLRALPRRADRAHLARSRTTRAGRSRPGCSAPRTSTPRSRASRPT